jgi:hypothetical protein
MADAPYWTAHAAVFSAVAAIASAIASFAAYRRTKRLKETDLRLELQRVAARVEADLEALVHLVASAKRSREAITAVTGRTAELQVWAEEYKADHLTLGTLIVEGRGSIDPDSLKALKLTALEETLARIRALQPRIQQLLDKYKASIEADIRERDRIRP